MLALDSADYVLISAPFAQGCCAAWADSDISAARVLSAAVYSHLLLYLMPVHGSDLAHLLYLIPLLCPCKFRLVDLDTRPLTLVRWPSCLVLSFAVSRG